MAPSTTRRFWCWTLNNYSSEDEVRLQKMKCVSWLLYGHEVGAQGTPHLQGAIWTQKAMTKQSLGRMMKNCWVGAPGAEKALPYWLTYCTKQSCNIVEVGVRPSEDEVAQDCANVGQGTRSDLVSLRDKVVANPKVTKRELWDEFPSVMARYPKVANELRRIYYTPPSLTVLDNEWIWGPSGTGKSSTAKLENPGAFVKPPKEWFDGYDDKGYPDVLIWEDFDRSEAHHVKLLKVLADYDPVPVEVKGGMVEIRPRRIIVTSNYKPSDIWTSPEDLEPILRRFKLRHFPDQSTIPECFRMKK